MIRASRDWLPFGCSGWRWQYAIATVDIRGYVSLTAGVQGQHKGTSYAARC